MKPRFLFLLLFILLPFTGLEAQLTSTPDRIETENGVITVDPINHGTVVLEWKDITIYADPYGGAEAFNGVNSPDLILITDIHGDHLNLETLQALDTSNSLFVVPQAVADELPAEWSEQIVVIGNGESTEQLGINITAIPMYNLPEAGSRHAKGRGNGYVLDMNGPRVYLSGDTEDIPEMRNLENIDVAFVCMNLPYTMDIYQATSAVLDFAPAIVYPYHHRGQDIQKFSELVTGANDDIEVRLKDWYPGRS